MSKRLYIDCQFFQTPAWDRGMGKYTVALLKHAADKLNSTDVILLFTKNLPKDKKMLSVVKKILPKATFLELDLKTTNKNSYLSAAKHNKAVLEQNINHAKSSKTVFLIPCLFQEPTAPVYPNNVSKLIIYYDAIPFLYFQMYRNAINYDSYLERHNTLLESDTILTISQTVKDDLVLYLGIGSSGRRVVSIDGAAIENSAAQPKKPNFQVPNEYILMSTSDDIRKNNRTAILAFEQFRKLSKRDFKLVLTSSLRKEQREQLQKLSKNVILTGNVDPAELDWLYLNSAAVLCASEYEGLGLPVLEAVRAAKPVVCSSIAVFRELSNEAFYFFDPLDIEDVAIQLHEAIGGKAWEEKNKLYPAINKKYTWGRSAGLFIGELERIFMLPPDTTPKPKKPHLAILSPIPSGYSAIGKLVQELHEVTSAHFDVDYFFEDRKKSLVVTRPNYLTKVTNCYDIADFNARRYAEYDYVIYHIGNSEYHFEIVKNALYLPGFTILHDTMLTEAFGEMVRLGYISLQRLGAESKLDEYTKTQHTAFITSLINGQIGCMVHSNYARKALGSINLEGVLVEKTNLPVAVTQQSVQEQNKRAVHVGLAGVLSGKRKGIDIIKEMASDPAVAKNTVFHVFGFNLLEPKEIEDLRRFDNIRVQTNLSDLSYQTQLANIDILVNYRSEYRGETSLSTLEAMRHGCVVVLSNLGWFGELPNDAVIKVSDHIELVANVRSLIVDGAKRHQLGGAARQYVQKYHSQEKYVEDLVRLMHNENGRKSINRKRANIIKSSSSLTEIEDKLKAANHDKS